MFNQLYPNLEVCSEYIFKEKKSYTLSKLYTSVRLSLYNKGPFISDAEKSTKMVFQFCFIFFYFSSLKKIYFYFFPYCYADSRQTHCLECRLENLCAKRKVVFCCILKPKRLSYERQKKIYLLRHGYQILLFLPYEPETNTVDVIDRFLRFAQLKAYVSRCRPIPQTTFYCTSIYWLLLIKKQ